jgi:hypothetical protein
VRIPRETFLAQMTFADFTRPFLAELFGPLVGLDDEWRRQGATAAELDLTAYDFDYVTRAGVGCHTGLLGGVARTVLAETDEYRIERDELGRTTKLFKRVASIPLPLDYPVRDMDSWLRVKPWYAFHEGRFPAGWEDRLRANVAAGHLIVGSLPGGFDLPRQLLGEEAACLACYDQPELLADILATAGDTAYRVLERCSAVATIDVLSVHEDLAGKSGSLIGPATIRTFVAPYYRRVWDMLRASGTQLFQQDSDGNLTSVLDAFVDECGLNASLPFESAAGMDIVAVRRRYGSRLACYGGLDKHVLVRGREAIVAELEAKLVPLRDEPGIVFGLDHRIVPGTGLADYQFYVRTARELLGLPWPPTGAGWQRMAF